MGSSGLSICQTIVVAHGGRIWAEPNVRGGAIVGFTLPVAPTSEAAAADVRDPAVRDKALVRD